MITVDLCLSDLPKEKIRQAKNGKKYITLIISKRQAVGQYGETHTLSVSRTKEERDAQVPTIYVGSGKEYQPQLSTPQNVDALPPAEDIDDLPF
jgi:hypothetical protein